MKRILASCFIVLFALSMNAQIKTCAYFDGYWSKWTTGYGLRIRGNYGGFIIYEEEYGPWYPIFKFTTNNFSIADSKTQKMHRKTNTEYKYTGTVEYFVCDDYMTAYDLFKSHSSSQFISPKRYENAGRPVKKIVSKAIIRIAPYKKHPESYIISYDKVALGVYLNGVYFKR